MHAHHILVLIAFVVLVVAARRPRGRPRNRPRRGGHSREYDTYLTSQLWRERRRRWAQAGGRCAHCPSRRYLTIHHLTYERLGHERDTDVAVLCWDCHQRARHHDRSPVRRAA